MGGIVNGMPPESNLYKIDGVMIKAQQEENDSAFYASSVEEDNKYP